MSKKSKQEYLLAIRRRYRKATKHNKKQILDEFCKVCGHHRKHAIRLLNKDFRTIKKKPGRKTYYDREIVDVLKKIWFTAEHMCSKRIKAILPIWLPHYEEHYGPLKTHIRQKLGSISPATIDRILQKIRIKHPNKTGTYTRPGSIIRKEVNVRAYDWKPTEPGYLEADSVAHCGESMQGDFVWSITFTDLYSQWTENRATWNIGGNAVVEQIKDIQQELPFPIKGFHVDNGSEFLNYHLIRHFSGQKQKISFTRSRPHIKNDNPHVEQKNYTHVRHLLGYQRIENPNLVPRINDLYRLWSRYNNFFCPNMKLISKTKIKGRYIKKYDTPKTPYQRLIESPFVKEQHKIRLKTTYEKLNPFILKKAIAQMRNAIFP